MVRRNGAKKTTRQSMACLLFKTIMKVWKSSSNFPVGSHLKCRDPKMPDITWSNWLRISPTLQIFTAASHSFEKAKNREIFFCYARRAIMEQDEWCRCRELFARGNSCIPWENQKMLPHLNLSHMLHSNSCPKCTSKKTAKKLNSIY